MTGYNPPTTDNMAVIKRRQQQDRDRTAEALRVGGTQPFQTTDKTKRALEELQQQQAELEVAQLQLEQLVLGLQEVVASIPITRIGSGGGGGFQPNDGWQTVASASIARPAGKGNRSVMAMGEVSFDFSNSGITWPYLDARVVIDGQAGPAIALSTGFYATGEGQTTGTVRGSASFARSLGSQSNVSVEVQIRIERWSNGGTGLSVSAQTANVTGVATFTP